MLSSDLRLIAERAATRDYMRARVTTVYSWDEYGVTVPGRLFEARVRTLSRSFHQVGDVVVLAAINGDPQLLVIIDAVGVGPSAYSPYSPINPVVENIWPMRGRNTARDYASNQMIPSSLNPDANWWDKLYALGVRGVSSMFAAQDRWVVRTVNNSYTEPNTIKTISLDASSEIWSYTMPAFTTVGISSLIVAAGQAYCWATYTFQLTQNTSETREGIVALDLASGAIRWGTQKSSGPLNPLAVYSSGNLIASGLRDGQPCMYELAAGNGDVVASVTATDLGSGTIVSGSDVVFNDGMMLICEPSTLPRVNYDLISVGPNGEHRWTASVDSLSGNLINTIRVVRATKSRCAVSYSSAEGAFGIVNVSASGSVLERKVEVGNPSTSWLWFNPTYYSVDDRYKWTAKNHRCWPVHGNRILQIVEQVPPIIDYRYMPGVRRVVAGGMGYHLVRLMAEDLSVLWEKELSYPERRAAYHYAYTASVTQSLIDQGLDPSPYWSWISPDDPNYEPFSNVYLGSATPRNVDYVFDPDPLETLDGSQRAFGLDAVAQTSVCVGVSSTLLFTARSGAPTNSSQAWVIDDNGMSYLGDVAERPISGYAIEHSWVQNYDVDAIPYNGSIYYKTNNKYRKWKGSEQ